MYRGGIAEAKDDLTPTQIAAAFVAAVVGGVLSVLLWAIALRFPTPYKPDPNYDYFVWPAVAWAILLAGVAPGTRYAGIGGLSGMATILAIGTLVVSYSGDHSNDPLWGIAVPYFIGLGLVCVLVAEATVWVDRWLARWVSRPYRSGLALAVAGVVAAAPLALPH